ncbi:MAG: hypothetical protein ACPGGK_13035 [Pikeienuella sp.]
MNDDIAKIVYKAMKWACDPFLIVDNLPPVDDWVEGGNSHAQTEARRAAQRIVDYMAESITANQES